MKFVQASEKFNSLASLAHIRPKIFLNSICWLRIVVMNIMSKLQICKSKSGGILQSKKCQLLVPKSMKMYMLFWDFFYAVYFTSKFFGKKSANFENRQIGTLGFLVLLIPNLRIWNRFSIWGMYEALLSRSCQLLSRAFFLLYFFCVFSVVANFRIRRHPPAFEILFSRSLKKPRRVL